jgi:hypothetical protein
MERVHGKDPLVQEVELLFIEQGLQPFPGRKPEMEAAGGADIFVSISCLYDAPVIAIGSTDFLSSLSVFDFRDGRALILVPSQHLGFNVL